MTLSDGLKELQESKVGSFPCKLARALDEAGTSAADRAAFDDALWPSHGPRVSAVALTKLLRSENIFVGVTTTKEHRRRECSCFWKASS